jgi:hypothetical protein
MQSKLVRVVHDHNLTEQERTAMIAKHEKVKKAARMFAQASARWRSKRHPIVAAAQRALNVQKTQYRLQVLFCFVCFVERWRKCFVLFLFFSCIPSQLLHFALGEPPERVSVKQARDALNLHREKAEERGEEAELDDDEFMQALRALGLSFYFPINI